MLLYDKKIILSILFSSPEFNIHGPLCFTLAISISLIAPAIFACHCDLRTIMVIEVNMI